MESTFNDQYQSVMLKKTDEQLLVIKNAPIGDYNADAVKAAKQEIERRKDVVKKMSESSDEALLDFLSQKHHAIDLDYAKEEVRRRAIDTKEHKQRHGFVTFWLWLGIIATILIVPFSVLTYQRLNNLGSYGMKLIIAGYDLSLFSVSNYVIIMQICAVLSAIVGIIFISKILNWKKFGFWGIVANGIVFGTINLIMMSFIGNEYRNVGLILFTTQQIAFDVGSMVISPLILWAILQIKKNGISCWKQLE